MVTRRACIAGVIVGLALAMGRLDAGGWAVVTMERVPAFLVAAKSSTLSWSVRQHGVSLTPGLSGVVQARNRQGVAIEAVSTPLRDAGYYQAAITLPSAGEWTLTIVSGFMASKSAPVPMRVVAADALAPDMTARERGAQLLAAKGCVTCHTHAAIAAPPGFATDLSTPRLAPDHLKAFLAKPSAGPRSVPNVQMPDLHLSDEEVSALTAFLTTPRAIEASVSR